MAIADTLVNPEITTEKIVGIIFLYASAALVGSIGSLLRDVRQLLDFTNLLLTISGVLFFVALVLTVYISGRYLISTR